MGVYTWKECMSGRQEGGYMGSASQRGECGSVQSISIFEERV